MMNNNNKKICSRCHHLLPLNEQYFRTKYNGDWYNRCIPCNDLDRKYNNHRGNKRQKLQLQDKQQLYNQLDGNNFFNHVLLIKKDENNNKIVHEKQINKNIPHTILSKIIKKIDMKIIKYQLKNYPKCRVCFFTMIPSYLNKKKYMNEMDMTGSVWLYCQNNKCRTFIDSNNLKREIKYYYNPWKNTCDVTQDIKSFVSREQWLTYYLDHDKTNIVKKIIEWKYLYFWLHYLTNGNCNIKNLNIFKIAYQRCLFHLAKNLNIKLDMDFENIWISLLDIHISNI